MTGLNFLYFRIKFIKTKLKFMRQLQLIHRSIMYAVTTANQPINVTNKMQKKHIHKN